MPRMRNLPSESKEGDLVADHLVRGEGTLDFLVLKSNFAHDGSPYKFHLDFRTFSSAELASITGVSAATQRDWRRRGIERVSRSSGWKRYTVSDLAFYSIIKLLTARGVSLSVAAKLATEAFTRVFGLLVARKGAFQFQPRGRNIWEAKARPTDRFIVASESVGDPEDSRLSGFANFTALNSFFRNNPQAIAAVVVDLKRVVDRICECSPMPLVTVIDETNESELADD
jgi:MerR HTH family regulatory protein